MQRRENSYLTNQNQALDRANKLADRNAKDKEKSLTAQYGAALNVAGNDSDKRAPILQDAAKSFAAGDLSEAKYRALVNPTAFTAEQDAAYEFGLRDKIVRGQLDSQTAQDQVARDAGVKLSWTGANAITKSFQGIKENEDRTGSRLLTQIRAAGSAVAPSAVNISPTATPMEQTFQANDLLRAQDQVHKTLLEQPDTPPAKAQADALRPIVEKLGVKDGSSPQEIDKILKEEAGQQLLKQSQGNLSVQELKAAVDRAHALLMKKKLMLLDQEAAKANGAGGGQ